MSFTDWLPKRLRLITLNMQFELKLRTNIAILAILSIVIVSKLMSPTSTHIEQSLAMKKVEQSQDFASLSQHALKKLQMLWMKKTTTNMSQDQVDAIYELLKLTVDLFEKAQIRYHLICGTALGHLRHGGLMPWDDDVDLGIHVNDSDKVWALKDKFAHQGYVLLKADIGFKIGSGDLREDVLDPETFEALGPKNPTTGINQDIFTFQKRIANTIVMEYAGRRARQTWPHEVVPWDSWFAKQERAMFGDFVNVLTMPQDAAEKYLKNIYGENWRTHNGMAEMLESEQLRCLKHSSLITENIPARNQFSYTLTTF